MLRDLYLLGEGKLLLDHDLKFLQADDIHRIDWFHMQHVVHQNRDYTHQNEAIIPKERKVQNSIDMFLLVEERISLDHDLRFAPVDDTHRIDWIHILRIVLQTPNHKDRIEATIINERITNDVNRFCYFSKRKFC
jgi:hypothetical protein